MDLKTFNQRTNKILETFQEVREGLSKAISLESGRDRQVKLWEVEDKLFNEVFMKYNELSWDLYQENVQLSNDRLRD